MGTDSISMKLEGQECLVYFFTGWGSYSHPVTPSGPILWEDALVRDSYYRTWMCQEQGEDRFVLFERINNQRRAVESHDTPKLQVQAGTFELIENRSRISLGNPLNAEEAFLSKHFLNQREGHDTQLEELTPTVDLSYRYHYDINGLLRTVTIINPEGKTSILNMVGRD